MMPSKRKRYVVIGMSALVLLALVAFIVNYANVLQRGELGQKSKAAFLQAVELEHREHVADAKGQPVLLVRNAGQLYSVLGIPSDEPRFPYVWILLDDPDGGDTPVKRMPGNTGFHLACSDLPGISAKVQVTPEVLDFMKSHCK